MYDLKFVECFNASLYYSYQNSFEVLNVYYVDVRHQSQIWRYLMFSLAGLSFLFWLYDEQEEFGSSSVSAKSTEH